MLVGELLLRIKILKKNIKDIKRHLANKEENNSNNSYNDFISQLFAHIEQLRSYTTILMRSNESSKISVGNKEVTISDAVSLKKAITHKIEILSSMIENNTNRDLNIFNLIEERDKLFEEYIYLMSLINDNDWSKEIQ